MKVHTRTTATIDVDDIEAELYHVPYNEPTIVQPSPTTLVVGYLVHDDYCENPMTSYDCEGTLYTYKEGVITDDNSAPWYLGLSEFGSSYGESTPTLEDEGIDERVKEYLSAQIKADPELTAWMVSKVMETNKTFEALVDDLVDDISGYHNPSFDTDDDQLIAKKLGEYDTLAEKAWLELYDEGKAGSYLAVPVRYCHSIHGPGTTSIHTTTLDNANAVWVPDACAIENMDFSACTTYAEKLAVAEKYASSTLKNYANWCNGECYGVVTEVFKLEDGEYVQQSEDSCWGFIGYKYAEKELESLVKNEVENLKEVA